MAEDPKKQEQEDPDVEAHHHRAANEAPSAEPEDKSSDDEPDVEGHMFRM